MRAFSIARQLGLQLLLVALIALGGVTPAGAQEGGQALFADVAVEADANPTGDPTIVRSRFVAVNFDLLGGAAADPAGASQTLALNLFDDARFTAVMDRIETFASGGYAWIGHLDGVALSSATLAVGGGVVVGNIVAPGAFYQVRYAGNAHVIHEIDPSKFPDEAPPIPVKAPAGGAQPDPASMPDSGAIIDVMVVYTPAARTAAGGATAMQNLVNLAVTETNQAYANSGVNQRINLVHRTEVSYTESGDFYTDLVRLTETSDGYIDNVHTLRNTYKADLVSMFIEGTQYCGIAWLMETVSASFASSGFSVIARNCATGYYSYGHEMGHNMGARHDWAVDPGTAPYEYAHGYVYTGGPSWRTIMAYGTACGGCTRLQYFSNPNVSYGGVPMGVPEGQFHPADNRKTFNNTAYTVANFRQGGSSGPGAPTLIAPGGSITDATPTFQWNVVSIATEYRLYVAPQSATGSPVIDLHVPTQGGSCNTSTCSYTPTTPLSADNYSWWAQSFTGATAGAWSAPMNFTLGTPPDQSTLIAPNGATNDTTPTFQWNTVSGGTSYRLYVAPQSDVNTPVIDVRVPTQGGSCDASTCAYTPTTPLAYAAYRWWVQSFNGGLAGAWSAPMDFLLNPSGLGAPVLLAPVGTTLTTAAPVEFQWRALSGATTYRLYLQRADGTLVHDAAYAASVCSGDVCRVTPPVTWLNGMYNWWVLPSNAQGNGLWSAQADFTLNAPAPGAATLTSPSGALASGATPTYQWSSGANATWYWVYVAKNGVAVVDQWVEGAARCSGGVCSLAPGTTLDDGAYRWWVQTWGPGGYGPWSAALDFTVGTPPPAAPTLVAPGGAVASVPVPFTWNAVATATHYRLYVQRADGTPVHDAAYPASQVGCPGGTGQCTLTPAGVEWLNGAHNWWVQGLRDGAPGAWSAQADFTLNAPPPTATAPQTPQGAVSDPTPLYTWSAVANATWYRLYVQGPSGSAVVDEWVRGAERCSGATCTYEPGVTLSAGAHSWWVQTWGPGGYGPWSAQRDFTVAAP